MLKRTVVVVVAFALVACKKGPAARETTDPATPTDARAQIDALWELAPAFAGMGGVVSGEALARFDSAWTGFADLARLFPGMGPRGAKELDATRARAMGGKRTFAEAGLDLSLGAAFFSGRDEAVVFVLPVSEPDVFVAAHGGTSDGDLDHIGDLHCKLVGDRYACASDPALLVLGGGDLGRHAGVRGERGDAELVVDLTKLKPLPPGFPLDVTGPITAVLTLRPGEALLRANVPATSPVLAGLTASPRARFDVDRASGFVILPLAPLAPFAPPIDLAPGVTFAAFLASTTGPLQLVFPAGRADAELTVPLSDPAPATALLARCGDLSGAIPVTTGPGECTVGPMPFLGASGTVWLDDTALRGARARGPVTAGTDASPPTAAGKELSRFTIAMWARGNVLGESPAAVPAAMRDMLAAFAQLNEFGVGVDVAADHLELLVVARTIHANPPEVVAELERLRTSGGTRADVEALVKRFPTTPLAADAAAGSTGFLGPTFGIGMIAAVAIPAFLEHLNAGATPPENLAAAEQLKTLAEAYARAHRAYPRGKTARTPPKNSCTASGGVFAASPAWWSDPMWKELGFSITDPFRHQYVFEGTGDTFVATVFMDLDCDGAEAMTIVRGTLDAAGQPVIEIVPRSGGPD